MITNEHINKQYPPSIEKEFVCDNDTDCNKLAYHWLYKYCLKHNYKCYLYASIFSSPDTLSPYIKKKGFSGTGEIKDLQKIGFSVIAEKIHIKKGSYGNINGILNCPEAVSTNPLDFLDHEKFIFLGRTEIDRKKAEKLLDKLFDLNIRELKDSSKMIQILKKYDITYVRVWDEHVNNNLFLELYCFPDETFEGVLPETTETLSR